MKNVRNRLIVLLVFLTTASPLCGIVHLLSGHPTPNVNIPVFSALIAGMSIFAAALCFLQQSASDKRIFQVLTALLPLVALINAVLCLIERCTAFVFITAILSVGCCFVLAWKAGKPMALKIVTTCLSALIFLGVSTFPGIMIFWGTPAVKQALKSPDGTYCAEVVVYDAGALGGATHVNVYEIKPLDFLVRLGRNECVYTGSWSDSLNMEICWKNDHCLSIDSQEHEIENEWNRLSHE